MTSTPALRADELRVPDHAVTTYLPFVERVARRIARRLPDHVQIEDLVGAGVVGLLEARERFDATGDTTFQSYAEFRIKGAILDELRRRDLMARDARTESKRIEATVGALTQVLGRPPEDNELATELGLEVDELHHKLAKLAPVHVLSMDDVAELQPSGVDSPFDAAARAQLRDRLAEAITQLRERHQQVLRLYYQEGLTLKQVGEVLGVTESRACQIMSDATHRLRARLTTKTGANDA